MSGACLFSTGKPPPARWGAKAGPPIQTSACPQPHRAMTRGAVGAGQEEAAAALAWRGAGSPGATGGQYPTTEEPKTLLEAPPLLRRKKSRNVFLQKNIFFFFLLNPAHRASRYINKIKEISTALHVIKKQINNMDMAVFSQVFATGEPRGGAPERPARGRLGGPGAPHPQRLPSARPDGWHYDSAGNEVRGVGPKVTLRCQGQELRVSTLERLPFETIQAQFLSLQRNKGGSAVAGLAQGDSEGLAPVGDQPPAAEGAAHAALGSPCALP